MPRFFFDLVSDSGEVTNDPDGADLATSMAAVKLAEIAFEETLENRMVTGQALEFAALIIRDECNRIVRTLRRQAFATELKSNTELKMPKEPKKLEELFHNTLKDIYFAEKKILATLPKMVKAAQNEQLRAAFEKHRGETEGHVKRLEEVFALIEEKPQGKTCAAIVGITDEGAEIMDEYKGSPALDAGLLAAAQAVEHYEISRYGTLRTWAEELGLKEAVGLLQETLDEEKATDEALTDIAESVVNQEAEAA